MSDGSTFYTRVRGRVDGPFDGTALQERAARGELSPADEVSPDGLDWSPAPGYDGLFDPPRPLPLPESAGPVYYYTQAGATAGPVPVDALRALAQAGTLGADDLVWADGDATSAAAWQVPALAFAYSRPLDYLTPRPAVATYGGFWRRAGAYLLDGIITSVANGLIAGGLAAALVATQGAGPNARGGVQLIGNVLGLVVAWLYFALFESSSLRATPGKLAVGIVVVDLAGNRINFGRATGRYFGKILSGVILGIGFLMAAWTEKKQALHDILAGTLVVRKV